MENNEKKMDTIDTLLLSGGAMKCLSILGSMKYLFERNIIKENFEGIKDIFFVSGASFYVTPLLLGYSIDSTLEIFKRINYSKNFDIMDTLKLSNLIQNYGFKSITEYHYTMESIIKEKGYRTDITLLDLYNIIPINVHFKVINITEDRIEYLNKDNSPNLKLIDAISMTCCIPILFEPLEYKGNKYIDGGVICNFPYEKCKGPHYIGINIITTRSSLSQFEYNNQERKKIEINSFGEYLLFLFDIYGGVPAIDNSINHIKIIITGTGIEYKKLEKKIKETIMIGYNQTKQHFSNFQLHTDSNPHEKEN